MAYETNETDRTTRHHLAAPAWMGIATAAAIGAAGLTILYARRFRPADREQFRLRWSGGQAVTIGAPLEEVEAAWVRWCASGNAKLRENYAVRFEPAPGARGTEVHLSGGGSKGAIREELRRFKQLIETGEVPVSDGPGPVAAGAALRRPSYDEVERGGAVMKATCWHGTKNVQVEDVPDPTILNPRDAIVRITSTAVCGSDLHLYNGFIPTMKRGDILGHEFMGEVVEVGKGVTNLAVGDRVVVPFPIACGRCAQCERENYSLCENSNPNAWMAEKMWGYSPCGIFGYSHMLGGYAGGQAEYARVPFADVGPLKVPDAVSDEQVLFLSDIFPTGYMAAEACNIQPGDVVAVWGCGPVGQFAIASAYLLGAERVIAIDRFPYRLRMARDRAGAAETINYEEIDVREALDTMTAGRGPDSCIDAVGMEGHAPGVAGAYDRVKTTLMLETDRPVALRQAILSCRSGGTISVAGVYGGFIDKFPIGAIVNRALTIRSGQTHVHRYMRPLLDRIRKGQIDPSFVITHRMRLEDAPTAYDLFNDKEDECLKVVLKP